jgi:hypothetical protein
MPYIDVNVSIKLNKEQREQIKSKLDELITYFPGGKSAYNKHC